jgi:GxxExxY protein
MTSLPARLSMQRLLFTVRWGQNYWSLFYEQCLAFELEARDIPFQRQVALPVLYRNRRIDAGFRMDMVVGGLVVVEIKAIDKIVPVHEAQLGTYLRFSGLRLGLLINFNVTLIKYGIKRRINSAET